MEWNWEQVDGLTRYYRWCLHRITEKQTGDSSLLLAITRLRLASESKERDKPFRRKRKKNLSALHVSFCFPSIFLLLFQHQRWKGRKKTLKLSTWRTHKWMDQVTSAIQQRLQKNGRTGVHILYTILLYPSKKVSPPFKLDIKGRIQTKE